MPFLTELDPRLKIRGSRDPLGIQAVWATVGRQLVGNLTLVSNDIASFRTLLIGYGLPAEDAPAAERLRLFLRWEQAAAACRVAVKDTAAPLGALRVRRALNKDGTWTLSEAPGEQILGDQRATGLWVLYHRAARTSGLVTEARKLTPTGHTLVDRWMNTLGSEASDVLADVRHAKRRPVIVTTADGATPQAEAIAQLLVSGTGADRAMLQRHLVNGIVGAADEIPQRLAGGRQTRLAALVAAQDPALLLADLVETVKTAGAALGDTELVRALDLILITETALRPADAAFDALLQDGHGMTVADIGRRIERAWPSVGSSVRANELRAQVAPVLTPALKQQRTSLWLDVADAAAASRWTGVVRGLLALHTHTMAQRGSAPWVRLDEEDVIDVRLREGSELPTEGQLNERGFNPYYLPPLRSLLRDLQEPT